MEFYVCPVCGNIITAVGTVLFKNSGGLCGEFWEINEEKIRMTINSQSKIQKIKFKLWICLLAFWVVGILVMSGIQEKMSDKNYLISSPDEQAAFEEQLSEKDIPYQRVSQTAFAVEEEYSEEADDIFKTINANGKLRMQE